MTWYVGITAFNVEMQCAHLEGQHRLQPFLNRRKQGSVRGNVILGGVHGAFHPQIEAN